MKIIESYINGIKVEQHVLEDIDFASDELKQIRLDICNTCEKRLIDYCTECNCLLINRVSYAESFCPLGKWNGNTL